MKKLKRLFKWVDNNILHILLSVFIFLIPLYPKLPIRMVNYTYIAIRLEDFFIAGFIIIYLIQLLRKKATINKTFLVLFIIFWVAVFASYLYGHFVLNTVPIRQLGFLNAARRVEYMAVFLIASSLIKSKRILAYYLTLNCIVFFIVMVYAIGQKFIGWPAVQTMNPEYAKGYLLILTPEARVSSTFSGHYDLAAYLIFFVPILMGFYFYKKNILYFLTVILAVFILVLTASRISYGAYIISALPFLIFIRKPLHFIVILAVTIVFTMTSNNLTSRFKRTFQVKQIFVNQNTGQVVIPQKITAKEVPAGSFYIGVNNLNLTSDRNLLKERLLEDLRNAQKLKGNKLSKEEEELLAASMAGNLKPVNTLVSDISFSTRLQVEWPRAINAFLKNPLLGSGPSSITEATDNDYLRSLGEFGLFGTLSFAAIFFMMLKKILAKFSEKLGTGRYLFLGYLFGLLGLLFNAGYIDVFEASKVAYFFWMISGLFIGALHLQFATNEKV